MSEVPLYVRPFLRRAYSGPEAGRMLCKVTPDVPTRGLATSILLGGYGLVPLRVT